MSVFDIPGEVANAGGEAIVGGMEAVPGVSSLPGFGGHPGLLQPQAKGNFMHHGHPTDFDHKSRLTQREIAELWILNGGDNAKADLASAVSMAESSGIVKNGNYCCKGLWAIYLTVNHVSASCAYTPSCATKFAIKLSQNGSDWSAWQAYTDGAYKKFLGKSGIHGTETHTTAGEIVSGATGGIGDVVGFIARLFEPSFWLRVGKGILGFLLLIFGALTLMKVLTGVDVPTGPLSGMLRGQISSAAGAA